MVTRVAYILVRSTYTQHSRISVQQICQTVLKPWKWRRFFEISLTFNLSFRLIICNAFMKVYEIIFFHVNTMILFWMRLKRDAALWNNFRSIGRFSIGEECFQSIIIDFFKVCCSLYTPILHAIIIFFYVSRNKIT